MARKIRKRMERYNMRKTNIRQTVNEQITLLDKLMIQLYRQPFETKISFNKFTNSKQQELGKRLREWYKTEIDSKRKRINRIFVEFWLFNGNHKILSLHRFECRLQKMFEGDYTFSIDHINDNVSSDEVMPFFISMFTSITFHLTKEPPKGRF